AELLLRSQQGLSAAEEVTDPQLIADSQRILGTAYVELPTGDRGANLAKAITCLEAALRVFTERDFPVDWARTQKNLGMDSAPLRRPRRSGLPVRGRAGSRPVAGLPCRLGADAEQPRHGLRGPADGGPGDQPRQGDRLLRGRAARVHRARLPDALGGDAKQPG